MGQLSRLVTLNLSHNDVVNFPIDHIDVMASLLTLDVGHNHIDRFPTEFPYLYRLHVVQAESNDLTELPRDIGLRMKGLVRLDVSDNLIATLPESIVKCPHLKVCTAWKSLVLYHEAWVEEIFGCRVVCRELW